MWKKKFNQLQRHQVSYIGWCANTYSTLNCLYCQTVVRYIMMQFVHEKYFIIKRSLFIVLQQRAAITAAFQVSWKGHSELYTETHLSKMTIKTKELQWNQASASQLHHPAGGSRLTWLYCCIQNWIKVQALIQVHQKHTATSWKSSPTVMLMALIMSLQGAISGACNKQKERWCPLLQKALIPQQDNRRSLKIN